MQTTASKDQAYIALLRRYVAARDGGNLSAKEEARFIGDLDMLWDKLTEEEVQRVEAEVRRELRPRRPDK